MPEADRCARIGYPTLRLPAQIAQIRIAGDDAVRPTLAAHNGYTRLSCGGCITFGDELATSSRYASRLGLAKVGGEQSQCHLADEAAEGTDDHPEQRRRLLGSVKATRVSMVRIADVAPWGSTRRLKASLA